MDLDNVFRGVWTNYDRGSVLGSTLTTSSEQGALLIAFTGFLIPYVASRFWRILCLALHISAKKSPHATHHQRQVILRNSSSPESGLVSLLRLLWAWRQGPTKVLYARILPIVAYATTSILVFTAFGGLSPRISTSVGNQVLLKGDNCSLPFYESLDDDLAISLFTETLNDAANYVQQCYSANSSGALGCDEFVARNLPIISPNYNASCPFAKGMCRGNETSLYLDTGYIGGNRHLGLNMPPEQDFEYRYVLQCSPLVTEGFSKPANMDNISAVAYNYGGLSYANGTGEFDYTYEVEGLDIQYYQRQLHGLTANNKYLLYTVTSYTIDGAPDPSSQFVPISELLRSDGDVSIVFLSGNGVIFQERMDDEWYRATDPAGINYFYDSNGSNRTVYRPAEAASPMGCVEQFQWCNTAYPNRSGCGPLASATDSVDGAAPFFNITMEDLNTDRPSSNDATKARFIWPLLVTGSSPLGLNQIVGGANSFASQILLNAEAQLPLPLDQWQTDVTTWFNISLAVLQSSFVNTAIGVTAKDSPPLNDQERKLCNSQKIQNNNTSTSFSLLALLITYIASGVIILLSFVAEPLLQFISKRRAYKRYEVFEWIIHDSLQLHRLAQEEIGMGTWSGGAEEVPTTKPDDELADVDISDTKHPVLCRKLPTVTSAVELKPSEDQSEISPSAGESEPESNGNGSESSGDLERPTDETIRPLVNDDTEPPGPGALNNHHTY
ncbi:hypothetical protein F4777DRAFT_545388 [Nemania sp. FL0916]|nr:hypothetical protein F4777DRAFT_545388 [Nemania sp. FL0916]